jgi:hypothetical protein
MIVVSLGLTAVLTGPGCESDGGPNDAPPNRVDAPPNRVATKERDDSGARQAVRSSFIAYRKDIEASRWRNACLSMTELYVRELASQRQVPFSRRSRMKTCLTTLRTIYTARPPDTVTLVKVNIKGLDRATAVVEFGGSAASMGFVKQGGNWKLDGSAW